MSFRIRLTVFAYRFEVNFSRSWATKNPAYVAVSRVGKSYGSYDRITCLPKAYRGYTRSDAYEVRERLGGMPNFYCRRVAPEGRMSSFDLRGSWPLLRREYLELVDVDRA